MDLRRNSKNWQSTATNFILNTNEIHIWKIDLSTIADKELINHYKLLSNDEKCRAKRFMFEKDRVEFVVGRSVLRILLGRYLKADSSMIVFKYEKNGKPCLADTDNYNLHFNLSNSGGVVVMGFTLETPFGVDVELVKPEINLRDIALRFFSKQESDKLFALPKDQIPRAFYNCWTRKEAFIKAKGDGLSFPLDQFEVSLTPGISPTLIATHWSPQEKEKWELFSFEVEKKYVGALAIERQFNQLEFFKWEE